MSSQQKYRSLRPAIVAMALAGIGETIYFLVWGLWLFPEGSIVIKLGWTAACTIAMGAVIGAGVAAIVLDRLDGITAAMGSAVVYTAVLSACTMICAAIDSKLDYFGGASEPALFIAAGLIPAMASSILYAWLLHHDSVRTVLGHLGIYK